MEKQEVKVLIGDLRKRAKRLAGKSNVTRILNAEFNCCVYKTKLGLFASIFETEKAEKTFTLLTWSQTSK